MNFLAITGCDTNFQSELCQNHLKDKLHMKFSALNVDFNGPSLDLLGLRKPAQQGIKEWYFLKIVTGTSTLASWPV